MPVDVVRAFRSGRPSTRSPAPPLARLPQHAAQDVLVLAADHDQGEAFDTAARIGGDRPARRPAHPVEDEAVVADRPSTWRRHFNMPQHRQEEFVRFLNAVERSVPALRARGPQGRGRLEHGYRVVYLRPTVVVAGVAHRLRMRHLRGGVVPGRFRVPCDQ